MKQVGRNDPCPCGSGRKYKHCCLRRNESVSSAKHTDRLTQLKREFSKYDPVDLVQTLAALQVYPANHSNALRLETAIQVGLSVQTTSKRPIDCETIKTLLNSHMPPNGPISLMEDPVDNAFTENVVYHGGNYVTYPGIGVGQSFVLRMLFQSLLCPDDGFPKQMVDHIKAASVAMLSLSDEIARRIGHGRNMDSVQAAEAIEVPSASEMKVLRDSIRFTPEDLDRLFGRWGIAHGVLDAFVDDRQPGDVSVADPFKNPLHMRPLVRRADDIIVVLPASMMTALRHFTWVSAKRASELDHLGREFRKILSRELEQHLGFMGYNRVDIELPSWSNRWNVTEWVFRIDVDKCAFVQLVAEDVTDYSELEVFANRMPEDLADDIDQRRQRIADFLTGAPEHECSRILLMTVCEGSGRGFGLGLSRAPDRSYSLIISADDLDCVMNLRDCDRLTLWKYARAREGLLPATRVIDTSFVDAYAFYRDHNHSFHCCDDEALTTIFVTPGFGRSLKMRSLRTADRHAAARGAPPKNISVWRRYEDENIPIYVPEGEIGGCTQHLIEGYLQPIWVSSDDTGSTESRDLFKVYLQVTDMLAYWMWQVTPSLREHIAVLGPTPIHVLFRLVDADKWAFSTDLPSRSGVYDDLVQTEVSDNIVTLTLAAPLLRLFSQEDNEGELLILRELLMAFASVLDRKGHCNTLSKRECDRIVEIHGKPSTKKMFFVLDVGRNPSLDHRNIPWPRLLQEDDMEEQLDGLVTELGSEAPPVGILKDRRARVCVCNSVVDVYLERLKSLISEHDWRSLLVDLIARHEALCHRRTYIRLTIPTVVACFKSIDSYVEDLAEEVPAIQRTALTLRTLIEIVAAEPPNGTAVASLDSFDRLLAVTYQLVNWAMLSDQIHTEVFDHGVTILPSGRIGVNRQAKDDLWDPFLRSKTLEDAEAAIANFEVYFQHEESSIEVAPAISRTQEDAFKAEFGFTLTELTSLHQALTHVGFRQGRATACLALCDLKSELTTILNYPEDRINTAVELLSLVPRDMWEEAPEGFTAKDDIWPWRFNRRLSYIRRPLVIGPDSNGEPVVFWGPRHAHEALLHLISITMTGRYKLTDGSSAEMRALIGEIVNRLGDEFTDEVGQWFEKNTDWEVQRKVPIKPGGNFDATSDLGDIDVLAIDRRRSRIYSIECKRVEYGRNAREIANEIERLLGERTRRSLGLTGIPKETTGSVGTSVRSAPATLFHRIPPRFSPC